MWRLSGWTKRAFIKPVRFPQTLFFTVFQNPMKKSHCFFVEGTHAQLTSESANKNTSSLHHSYCSNYELCMLLCPVFHSWTFVPPSLCFTERFHGEVPRPADVLRADHHRPGRAGLHRVGLPGGGRGPPAQKQPVQGNSNTQHLYLTFTVNMYIFNFLDNTKIIAALISNAYLIYIHFNSMCLYFTTPALLLCWTW